MIGKINIWNSRYTLDKKWNSLYDCAKEHPMAKQLKSCDAKLGG